VLRTDKQYAPFRYIDSEKRCKVRYPISKGDVNLKGFIDRIDEKEGRIRILDYKTGSGNSNSAVGTKCLSTTMINDQNMFCRLSCTDCFTKKKQKAKP